MDKSLTGMTTATLVVACLYACSEPLGEPFEAPELVDRLVSIGPEGWSLVERRADSIPYGHHETGHGGELLVLLGPGPVQFLWSDASGEQHAEPLARESLELWILPGAYRPHLKTFLVHHRPVPAERVYSSRALKVYGRISHRITDQARFEELSRQARSTSWSDIENKTLSWSTWRQDISDALNEGPRSQGTTEIPTPSEKDAMGQPEDQS